MEAVNKMPTILIAEDEEDLREMYTRALEARGFEVLGAENGKEVIDILDRSAATVDLLLLDIVMPQMDGFEVLEKISKRTDIGHIPIIVSTNLDNEDDRREALSLGAADYFVKSRHTPMELADEVRRVLEQHRPMVA
ncbi:MAG TPA: response regulator [Candidatus Moranbacteria bacterium]|nr:response regulator [Candidatus Moranbacteria bacterium]